jgi:hypothetical protein
MTSLPPPDPDFRVELANTPLGSISEDASAPWLVDRAAWSSKLASVLPTGWLHEIATTYLAEAAHEIRAMSCLLADGAASASLDVLVRAVLERSGKVLWVLDPGVPLGSTRRVARAGLEISLSYAHYKSALRRLGAKSDVRSQVDSEARAHRNLLECWFTLDGARLDRNDPNSPVVAEPAKWKLDGQTLITYTAAAGLAAERAGLAASRGSAMYGGLAGLSHPSVVFAREVRSTDEAGIVRFELRDGDLEKSVRTAVLSFLNAANAAVTYYDSNVGPFQA